MAGPLSVHELMALLRAHPSRLSSLTRDIPADLLAASPGPESWSPLEILAHAQECSDVWGASIRRILAEDQPRIRYVSPRSLIGKTDYRQRTFADLLEGFTRERGNLLATLRPSGAEGWARSAIVTHSGKSSPWTVRDYAERLATHELDHVQQIEQIVAAVPSA